MIIKPNVKNLEGTSIKPEKKKVLFLLNSLVRAGAEVQLVDLVNGLDPAKFEKTIVIFGKNTDQLARIDRNNVDFHQLARANKFDGRIIFKLAALIRDKKPDGIHCTNQFTMFIAWAATRLVRTKAKLLVALHTTKNISSSAEIYQRTLYRLVMARFDCVVFVCNTQAEYWQRKYKEIKAKSVVIYNGVDPVYFSSRNSKESANKLRGELGVKPDEAVIACIAAFRPEKAHDKLIAAFSQLGASSHLVLAGDGPLRSQVESQVQRLKLQQRVHFVGKLEDVRPVLELADVTVLSSTAVETFSIAMLESMAMGTPVVATDVGGLREAVIPEKTGYLVAAGSVTALSDALSEAISNRPNLARMGVNSQSLVLEKFSVTRMIDKTSAILHHVIEDKLLQVLE